MVDLTERGCRDCGGCIEGCCLRSNTNRFKVYAAAAGTCTVLAIDIRTVREMRTLIL